MTKAATRSATLRRIHAIGLALISASLAAILLSSETLTAQWLDYPTPGVPRLADGSPNLTAPAPRTADGMPDLSGIWRPERNQKCPPDGCPDNQMSEQFLDLGWGLPGGLPYQPWAAALVKARTDQSGKDDPTSQCFPGGIVRLHTYPSFSKFLQTANLLVILTEREVTYRQIFLDGRPLPTSPLPTWKGYSVGRWDKDALVVTSRGFRGEGIWLDRKGSPLTEAATITERFTRLNIGRMDIEVTVDDPKAYRAPFTVTLRQFLALDTELLDFVCLENHADAAGLLMQ
ncbi:MAG: hypothetical protein HOP16_11670 [Acidobacteria bacterium]|nr:hypothetical protein [Acidobacteriota bacterium]